MNNWPLLSIVTFLPLVGVVFLLLIRGETADVARNARNVALLTSVATFLVSLLVWVNFDPNSAEFQMVDQARWLPGYSIVYKMMIKRPSGRRTRPRHGSSPRERLPAML